LRERPNEPFTLVDAVDATGVKLLVLERLAATLLRAGVLWSSSDGRRNPYLYRGHPENRGAAAGHAPARPGRGR
jgi:hypothetical protein